MEIDKDIESLLEYGEIEKAKRLLSKVKNKALYLYYWSEIERTKGFISRCIKPLKTALKNTNDSNLRFKIVIRMASVLRALGRAKEAMRYLKIAQGISPNSEEFLLEKAMVLRLIERYKEALKIFRYLKNIYIKKGDYQGLSYILWAEGGMYRNMGRIYRSIRAYEDSLKYAKKAEDNTLILYSTLGLAGVIRIAGMLKRSLRLYLSCIKKAPSDDLFAKAYSYCGSANALRQMGSFKEALRYYKIALNYYTTIEDDPDTALVLWGMAECYKKYNLKKALECISKAKKYLRNSYEIRGKILLKLTEAQIRYALGDNMKARRLFFQAISLAKKHKLNTPIETFG